MALIQCSECGKDISDQASACPSCGCPISKASPTVPETAEKKSGLAKGCGMVILIFIGGFVLLAILGSFIDDPDPGKDPITACLMAEEFVKKRLKSPASADFGRCTDDNVTTLGSGGFVVANYVDAENSFGANIRTNYICKVEHTGGKNWRLISIDGL